MVKNKRILPFFYVGGFLFSLVACSTVSGADGIVSPINGKILEPQETQREYSFWVAGHVYGAPGSPSVFPAASFLANIDELNQSGAKFLILTGDIIWRATPEYINNFETSVGSTVQIPIFNAVGNHDLTDRELYETHFGRTHYDFR